MKNQPMIAKIVLWSARILNALILAFFLFFILAHLFGDAENGNGFQSTTEIVTFIFFPTFTMVGLILAWKWELLGGLILIASMLGLFAMRTDLISSPYFLVSLVLGILYLLHWRLNRTARNTIQESAVGSENP